ncbi:MAG: CvpA family protein [Clostridia bacterium]|nr:CvpA family protein [Clostridia bacterium]
MVNTFNSMDTIVLLIIVGFLIYGLARGFMKQVIGLICIAASFILAYTLSGVLCNAICNGTTIDEGLATSIRGIFSTVDVTINKADTLETLSVLNLPEFLNSAILKYAEKIPFDEFNLAQIISETVTRYVLSGGSFMIILIVSRLLLILVKKLLSFIVDHTPLKVVDRILGAVVGLVKGILIVYLGVFLLSVIPIEGLNGVKELLSTSVIANFFMSYNLFGWLLGLLFT